MDNIVSFANSRSGHLFILKNIEKCLTKRNRIHDLENYSPFQYKEQIINRKISRNIDNKINVLIIRDFLNWIASLYHIKEEFLINGIRKEDYGASIKIWNNITKEAFKETYFIENSIFIIYDKFIENEEYRKNIIEIFGEYDKIDMEAVPEGGGGSSFDKLNFQNRGSKMDVLNRYKDFYNDPDFYLSIFRKNPEAIEVYKRNFEISKEKEEILNLI